MCAIMDTTVAEVLAERLDRVRQFVLLLSLV